MELNRDIARDRDRADDSAVYTDIERSSHAAGAKTDGSLWYCTSCPVATTTSGTGFQVSAIEDVEYRVPRRLSIGKRYEK